MLPCKGLISEHWGALGEGGLSPKPLQSLASLLNVARVLASAGWDDGLCNVDTRLLGIETSRFLLIHPAGSVHSDSLYVSRGTRYVRKGWDWGWGGQT